MRDEQSPPSPPKGEGRGEGATPSPSRERDSLGRAFHFDADETQWYQRLRESGAHDALGHIGDYELLDEIGRGGQGVVFKARQPRTGREIAVKRLSAGAFATPDMRARFEREIEAAVALDHPNIVTVFGTEVVDGQPLLAMKWIDGVPIDRWARPPHGASRPTREILEVFTVVCDAVHHAHQRGVIHRDLKPSNILVDKENRPFVLDFGLAKVAREPGHAATITMTGQFLGTPAYAAPEQIRGDVRAVDVRTDVYALGAILYRLLTGALPFADTGDLPALMQNVLHREPLRPSSHDADLNREVDVILLKALAKDKDQRYASVDALADDLRRFLTGQAVLAHPPSTVYQVRKFVRQHRASVAASGVFVILLVTATVVSMTFFFQSERERRRADAALVAEREQLAEARRQQARAEREATKANDAIRFVTDMLSRADRGAQRGNPNVTVREVLDASAQQLESGQIKYEPEVEASVRLTIATTYSALGLAATAEPHYLRALDLLREAYGETDLRVAESMHKLSTHYKGQGRLADAEPLIDGALRIRQALIANPNDPVLADTYVSLGVLRRQQGRFEEAERLYLKAIDIQLIALGEDDEEVARTKKNLAVLYLFMKRTADAEKLLRENLDFFERHRVDPDGDIMMAKENLAMAVFERHGNRDPDGEAESLLRDALASRIQLDGDHTGSTSWAYLNLSNVLEAKDRLDEAGECMREAVATAVTERFPSAVNGLVRILHLRQGRSAEAEAILREALVQREPFLGASHPAVGHIKLNIGLLLTAQGKFKEAEPFLITSETVLAPAGDLWFANVGHARKHLASLYEQWDAAEPGQGYAEKADAWRAKLVDALP